MPDPEDSSPRSRDFTTDVLPYLLIGIVVFCLLCVVPVSGYFVYRGYQSNRSAQATAEAQQQATALANQLATAQAEALLVQPPATWTERYADDFSSPSDSVLHVGQYDDTLGDIAKSVADGQYHWQAPATANAIWWSGLEVLGDLTDFYAAVDGRRVSGTDYLVSYGITFRLRGENEYYYYAVADSGSFALHRLRDQGWTAIVDWQDTDVIRSGGWNRLAVRAVGDTFYLGINERLVATAEDASLAQGQVGLAINLYEAGEAADVAFDNFVVYAP